MRGSKRDDYDSPKRSDDYGASKRDRRDTSGGYNKRGGGSGLNDGPPQRHSSTAGGGGYNPMGSHGRSGVGVDGDLMPKPYIDHGPSRGSSDFRRGGNNMSSSSNMNNVTLIGGNSNGGGGSGMPQMIMKDERSRYSDNGSQGDMRYGNATDRGMSAPWNSNSGPMAPSKPFGNSQGQSDPWKADDWRSMDSGGDRYDRTYNERKSPYIESNNRSGGGGGGSGGGSGAYLSRPQDRYNSMSSSSRFDSGRF